MVTETRRRWHDALAALEMLLLDMGGMAEDALARAIMALEEANLTMAEQVIAGDDSIDEAYLAVERQALELLALQTPVAVDLRLISAILHINLHLERVGDIAVNIAKIYRATRTLPTNPTILAHLQEMADIVRPMLRRAMEAFSRRDLALSLRLAGMDDRVDRLNRGMYHEVAKCANNPLMLDWAIRMMVVSRQLERLGDHAVDIAEQVAFLVTGQFREFSDASHPVPPLSPMEYPMESGGR
jgi:phosphate transport system protein